MIVRFGLEMCENFDNKMLPGGWDCVESSFPAARHTLCDVLQRDGFSTISPA
jgi:hypothetical protein